MKTICRIYVLLLTILLATLLFPQQALCQNDEQRAIELMSDTANARKVKSAIALYNKVKKLGNYIKKLDEILSNGEMPLPCGLGEGKYTLVLSDLKHVKNGNTQITATCAVALQNDTIAFGGTCTISGQCGTAMPAKIELLANKSINLGKHIKLTFNKGTYCEFDCDGITHFFGDITVTITSEKIFTYDNNYNLTDQKPSFHITTEFETFEDLTCEISSTLNFGIKGLNDFIFTMEDLVFDMSENRTPAAVRYPDNYFSSNSEIKLWKGFSAKNISVTLPKSICKDGDKRTTVGCKSMLIDRNGISVTAYTDNIPHGKIDTTKWQLMAESASITLIKNSIDSVSFYGIANIPPFGKNSKMNFGAHYNVPKEEFEFECRLQDKIDFPVFGANLTLNPTSYVNLKIGKDGFDPLIHADGIISIETELSSLNVSLPDIKFEGMELRSRKPYFKPGVMSLAVSNASLPSIGGFQMEVDNIDFKDDGLSFEVKLKLNEMLNGAASLKVVGDFEKYKIKKVELSRAEVHYQAENTLSIDGAVEIKKGDNIYGNGFRGDLDIKLLNKYGINAVGVFGKKDDNRYFLADVLAEANPLFTIPPCIKVSGLGGGLYRHMDQTTQNYSFGKALSGICYVPDAKVGFGFLAHANFYVGQKNTLNAQTTFEIQFNNNWGLNYVQLKGDAAFMRDPNKWGKFTDKLSEFAKAKEAAGGCKNTKAEQQPDDPPKNAGDGILTASILMKYDNNSKIFNADLVTYLNSGIIKGSGPNNRLVWAKAQFGNSDWYLHMGTPTNRCGVEVLDFVKLKSYFMLGNGLPSMPAPPDNVLKDLSASDKDKFLKRINNDMPSTGKGVAFGLSFSTDINCTVGPFYAGIDLGAGSEFMLADYGKNAYCKGREGTLGLNGWYAEAQVWAYLDAAVGIKARLFGKTRKFDFLSLHSGACLKGMGPNPFYFTGVITGSYRILGGLLKGSCHIDFECGTKCEPVKDVPLLGEDMIAQITPGNAEKDVNVFVSPQLILNIASETEMTITNNRNETGQYKVVLENFTLKKEDGTIVKGKAVKSDDGLTYTFDPEEALESHTVYIASASVVFMKKVGTEWVKYSEDGNDYTESKSSRFTSGERPDHILPEHLLCAYPQIRHYNFYPKEYDNGYILITENYSYLFTTDIPEGYIQKVRIETLNGQGKEFSFTSQTINKYGAKYEIDFNLNNFQFSNNEIYKILILNVPKTQSKIDANVTRSETAVNDQVTQRKIEAQGELNMLETKEIVSYCFKTSKFNTFKDKLAYLKLSGNVVVSGSDALIKNMTRNLITDEFPDGFEYQYLDSETGFSKDNMIVMTPLLNQTEWYKNSIFPHVYNEYTANQLPNKDTRYYNFPPDNAMIVFNAYFAQHDRLNDNEINSGTPTGLPGEGIARYYVVYQCDQDVRAVKELVGRKLLNGQSLKGHDNEFKNYYEPAPYSNGTYPFKVSYRLPGKGIITTTTTENFVVNY